MSTRATSLAPSGAGARPGLNLRPVVPIAVVAATFGLASVAGLIRLPATAHQLVYAAVGLVGLVVTVNNVELGLAVLPLIGVLVPFSIGTGTQSPLVAALLFAIALIGLWFARFLLRRQLTILAVPVNLPLCVFMLVWIVSFLHGEASHDRFVWTWDSMFTPRVGQLAIVLVSGLVMLLAMNAGRDLRLIQIATWGLIATGVIPLAAYYLHRDSSIGFLEHGGLYTMWVVTLAYGQALFNDRLPWWLRWLLVGFVIAWVYKATFGQTLWFSGWVPAVVAMSVQTLFKNWRWFCALAVAIAVAVLLNYSAVYTALYTNKVNEGDLSRLGIWQQAFTLFKDSPVLGTGPAGYAAYNMSVYLHSIYSMSSHNGYIDIIVETGGVGVLAYLWFALTMLYTGWKARLRWTDGFTGGFAQGAFGGLIGLVVAMQLGDWFIPFVYNETIAGFRFTVHSWVFLGFLFCLAVYEAPAAVPAGRVAAAALSAKVQQPRGARTRQALPKFAEARVARLRAIEPAREG